MKTNNIIIISPVSSTESLLDSMYYNIDRTYVSEDRNIETTERWDLNVIFQSSVNLSWQDSVVEDIKRVDGVDEVEVYTKGLIKAKAKGDKDDQNLILQGIDIADSEVH
ncbi:unnamed protein product, partial [marine sediment metagenome]